MSREIENITASFRKYRIEGAAMLQDGRITADQCQDVMRSFETEFKNIGVKI